MKPVNASLEKKTPARTKGPQGGKGGGSERKHASTSNNIIRGPITTIDRCIKSLGSALESSGRITFHREKEGGGKGNQKDAKAILADKPQGGGSPQTT